MMVKAAALLIALLAARAEAELRIGAAEGIGADRLAEALRLRLDVPVLLPGVPDAGAEETWHIDVVESVDGRWLHLRSPDGRRWDRPLASPGPAAAQDRAREASIAAASLWAEAWTPGTLEAPAESPLPPPVELESGGDLRFGLEWIVGAEGDLWGEAGGRTVGAFSVLRPSLQWAWGLWFHLEAGFGASWADPGEPLALSTVPIRLGAGWEFPIESGAVRAALQASVQPWFSLGGVEHGGWRAGAGLLVCASWHPVPGIFVGADMGIEFLPRAVEVRYRDEPVLGLGQLRWRLGAWIGFEPAAL